jgi:phospholipid/cholesterol/gamma-HCH transport system substrate-binding protein
MSPEPAAARRVGLLVLAAVTVAAVAVLLIGDRQNLFHSRNHYFVRWVSVSGLREGSQVQLNGVHVGSVERIELPTDTGTDLITVWISIDERYQKRLRADSVARIKTLGLLGDKYVEVTSGSPAAEMIAENGEIPAAAQTNVDQLAEAGEDVMNNVVAISHDLATILGRMERGEGILGELTTEVEPGRKVTSEMLDTLRSLRQAAEQIGNGQGVVPRLLNDPVLADRLSASADRLDVFLAKAEQGQGLLPSLLTDTEQRDRFARVLDNLDHATARLADATEKLESSDAFIGRLLHDQAYGRQVTDELERLLKHLASVAEKLDQGDGSAARLLNDPTIAQSIEDIVVGVNESKLLRWLIRNRQKQGIEKRYQERREELERQGIEPEQP